MLIFLSIVGFAALIGFGVYSVGVIGQNKILKAENNKLIQQNEELRDLLLSDTPTPEIPPHIARKKILYG